MRRVFKIGNRAFEHVKGRRIIPPIGSALRIGVARDQVGAGEVDIRGETITKPGMETSPNGKRIDRKGARHAGTSDSIGGVDEGEYTVCRIGNRTGMRTAPDRLTTL